MIVPLAGITELLQRYGGAYGICLCSSRDIFNSASNVDHGDEPVGSADEHSRDDVIVPLFRTKVGMVSPILTCFHRLPMKPLVMNMCPKGRTAASVQVTFL